MIGNNKNGFWSKTYLYTKLYVSLLLWKLRLTNFLGYTRTQFIELTVGKSQDVPWKEEFYSKDSRLYLNTFHPNSMHIYTFIKEAPTQCINTNPLQDSLYIKWKLTNYTFRKFVFIFGNKKHWQNKPFSTQPEKYINKMTDDVRIWRSHK